MKRLHVHMSVEDLGKAITFYSEILGCAPDKVKDDYARWLVEDPRLNFAVSSSGCGEKGVGHLGLQADNEEELSELYARVERAGEAGAPTREDGKTACCYALSEKNWVEDPTGLPWEIFHTYGEAEGLAPRAVKDPAEDLKDQTQLSEGAVCCG